MKKDSLRTCPIVPKVERSALKARRFRKTNHLAVAGFLLPFLSAGVTSCLILLVREDLRSPKFFIPYLSLVPIIFLAGLVSSLKSIPLIEERNDKDYAYCGLTLNILSIAAYTTSLIYLFFVPSP
jgi:hypothetical protein